MKPGSVIESPFGCDAAPPLLLKDLVDIDAVIKDLFNKEESSGKFLNVVDRQQARGWLAADMCGFPLLAGGTAKAERGTARGVGLLLVNVLKTAVKDAAAIGRAAEKRAKRAGSDKVAAKVLAARVREEAFQAPAPNLGLPPPSRRDRDRRRVAAVVPRDEAAAAELTELELQLTEVKAERTALRNRTMELIRSEAALECGIERAHLALPQLECADV